MSVRESSFTNSFQSRFRDGPGDLCHTNTGLTFAVFALPRHPCIAGVVCKKRGKVSLTFISLGVIMSERGGLMIDGRTLKREVDKDGKVSKVQFQPVPRKVQKAV